MDWRVLSYFEIYEWSTASQACELMGLDKAAVSRSLAMLKDNGWLKSRPSGLRKVEYATTATGKKLHDRDYQAGDRTRGGVAHRFTTQERENLIRYLHRLLGNLDAVRAVGRDEASPPCSIRARRVA